MREWLKDNSDKILLLVLTTMFFWPAIHNSQYAQRTSDIVLGAFIMLITGKVISKKE
jgi:hypothetical protein